MKNIHFLFSIVLLSFFNTYSYSQETYELTYEYEDSNNIILESKLFIKGEKSLYKIIDNRTSGFAYDKDGNWTHYVLNDELSSFYYTDSDYVYSRIPYPKELGGVIYRYSSSKIDWEITEEIKRIGNYDCIKATAILNGRDFEVWFTTDYAISKGPLKLNGLPGLIVEARELKGLCKIKLLDIKKADNLNYISEASNFFSNNDVLEYKDYEKIIGKYVVESKIKKAQKVAELLKDSPGSTIDFQSGMGEFFWVRFLTDIPKGAIEELKKIDL